MKRLTFLKPLTFSLLVVMLLAGTSCENFLDVNTDPNAATEAPPDLLFTEATVTQQSQRGIELLANMPLWSQHWASGGSAGGLFLQPENYSIGGADFTVRNSWGGYFTNGLGDLSLAIQGAQEAGRSNAVAQAQLMSAYIFYQMTVIWGDMPFSETLDADQFTDPSFDSQEDILRGLIPRIDDALSNISGGTPADAIQSNDVIYNGDMDQWERFGNSLKLRILMMIYNKDASVASQINTVLGQPLIRTNADNAEFPYSDNNGNENQFYQLHEDFAGGNPAEGGFSFFRANTTLLNLMQNRNDPRIPTYFAQDTGGGFSGVNPGAPATFTESGIGSPINRPAFPGRMITAAEVHLHEAEFLLRENGAAGVAAARTSLEAGIRASIDYFDGSPFNGEIAEADEDTYVNNILTSFDTGTLADKIRIVQEELYIDVFEKTPENWAFWKRTHVPTLTLPQNAVLGDIIRRMPYSTDEQSSNENFPESTPTLDTPMWYEN